MRCHFIKSLEGELNYSTTARLEVQCRNWMVALERPAAVLVSRQELFRNVSFGTLTHLCCPKMKNRPINISPGGGVPWYLVSGHLRYVYTSFWGWAAHAIKESHLFLSFPPGRERKKRELVVRGGGSRTSELQWCRIVMPLSCRWRVSDEKRNRNYPLGGTNALLRMNVRSRLLTWDCRRVSDEKEWNRRLRAFERNGKS